MEAQQQKHSEEVHLLLAGFRQQDAFIKENISRIEEEIRHLQEEADGLNQNQGNTTQEIRQREAQIENLKQAIAESAEVFSEIEAEITQQTQNREYLNKKHKTFLEQRETLSRHMAELD